MRRFLTRFCQRDDGSVAIEAIFIIPLFFMMVASIFEAGWVFHKTAMVEQAVVDAGRKTKVGQAYSASYVQAGASAGCPYGTDDADGNPCPCRTGKECNFDELCVKIAPYLDGRCTEQLSVEVRTFESFSDVASATDALQCPDESGYTFGAQTYDPGRSNDIVRVRACFVTGTVNPIFGALDLATSPNGDRRIRVGRLFRNEPSESTYADDGGA